MDAENPALQQLEGKLPELARRAESKYFALLVDAVRNDGRIESRNAVTLAAAAEELAIDQDELAEDLERVTRALALLAITAPTAAEREELEQILTARPELAAHLGGGTWK